MYLARAFKTDIDTVVKFFIFILIFVFDPMAIALIIAYNRTLEDEEGKVERIDEMFEMYKRKPKAKKSIKKVVKEELIKTKFTAIPDPSVVGELETIPLRKEVARGGTPGI